MEVLYLLLFVCYATYAFNRKSVVWSMPSLKAEGLDASDAGLIASCQNVAFSLSKFLAGVLSDRLNPNLLFASGLVLSGVATLLFSWSSSVTAFCSLWFINGLAQGCGWPAVAKILSQRAPPSQFGTLWSFLSCSANFSGSLGPFLSAYIIVNYGWRWNVFSAGFLTLVLCAVFLLSLPFLSGEKSKESEDKKPSSSQNKDENIPLSALFLDPFIWLLSICSFVLFSARTTAVDWGQIYLMEEKDHSQYVASAFISSIEVGGFVGRMLAGYVTDGMIKKRLADSKQMSPHWKPLLRNSVALVFFFGSVVSLHLFRFAVSEDSSSVWITFIGAFMGMCFYGPISLYGIVSVECVPPSLSGASHAIVALFENLGATASGLPFNYMAKQYDWSTVFLMLEISTAVIFLLMAACRNLTPKIKKVKED